MGDAPDMNRIEGGCLCGAVTILSRLESASLRICHCGMCRRHGSAGFMSIANDPQDVQVTGPVEVYRSSDWAERGFCRTCGSTLWYGNRSDGARHLSAGLFEDAGGALLKLEFFADQCPQGYGFAGDHKKLTTTQTIALFAPNEGETQ